MKLETSILKIFLTFTTIFSLGFAFIVIPEEININGIGEDLFLFVIMYISLIPFLYSLLQTFNLLTYIEKGNIVSELGIKALEKIKYSALLFSVLYVILLPRMFKITQEEDAPGVLLIGLIFTFFPLIIALFVSLLHKFFSNLVKNNK